MSISILHACSKIGQLCDIMTFHSNGPRTNRLVLLDITHNNNNNKQQQYDPDGDDFKPESECHAHEPTASSCNFHVFTN